MARRNSFSAPGQSKSYQKRTAAKASWASAERSSSSSAFNAAALAFGSASRDGTKTSSMIAVVIRQSLVRQCIVRIGRNGLPEVIQPFVCAVLGELARKVESLQVELIGLWIGGLAPRQLLLVFAAEPELCGNARRNILLDAENFRSFPFEILAPDLAVVATCRSGRHEWKAHRHARRSGP